MMSDYSENEGDWLNSAIFINQMDDYYGILKRKYGFTHLEDENTGRLIVPKELGRGYISAISPCCDVEISIMHLRLLHPLVMCYENFDCMFEATYCFSGYISCSETGVIDTCLSRNELGIYIKPNSRGMMMYPSGEEIFAVSILAKNQLYKQLPYKDDFRRHNSTCHNLTNALMSPKKTSVQIQNLFSQIIENQIDDQLQPSFLEGASKMILSLLWQNNVVNTFKGVKSCSYCSADQKAIQEVEHILRRDYMNPPTTGQLSKMVAINEYKLKNGFREMFGKTIYEYIRQLRMSNAKNLLENDDLSISQIAYMVGYINTSHFARAFRKEYGVNPSDLRS